MLRAAVLAILLIVAETAALAAPKTIGWNAAVGMSKDGSFVLGNPDAKVKVTEYLSYTCAACATFAIQAESQLRITYISSSLVSLEVRPVITNPVDLTLAMLAQCGPQQRFFLNHGALLRSQPGWRARLASAGEAQRQRWRSGTLAQRNRAIASDFKFYDLMAGMGFDPMTVDRCLSDQAAADRITALSAGAADRSLASLPAFAINGELATGANSWAKLRPLIDKAI